MNKNLLTQMFVKTALKIFRKAKLMGYSKFVIEDFHYEAVIPSANYAPWSADTTFHKTYKEVKGNTLVDIYRCFELWELTERIHHLDKDAHFIEIGVWRGGSAAIIGKKLSLLKSNAIFYLADTFTGVKKSSEKDKFYFDNEHADTSLEAVKEIMKDKFTKYKILTGIFPDETSHHIEDQIKFGFCHIDVDVYKSAREIVEWIWSRMIVGGVIIFDDYGFHSCNGVTTCVNEYKNETDRIIVHNINGHALMFKLK